jgi:ribose transport system substrate-binding protein
MPRLKHKPLRGGSLAVAVLSVLALAACGSTSNTTSASTVSASASSPTTQRLKIAFLPGVTANPYFDMEIQAQKQLAAKENVDLTIIDSQLDANKQVQQVQDLASTKQYDGIVVVPLNGAALVPAVRLALQAGIKVAADDVPIGPDPTKTSPQVDGLAGYAGRTFWVHGVNMGKLTVQACAGKNPCKVAFLYGVKASTYDTALSNGFKQSIASSPGVQIVAEGQGGYTRAGGLAATQDLVQAHKDLNVLVAVDQEALGAEDALKSAGLAEQVKIVGFGGTRQAVDAVRSGQWFGDSVQVPLTEGQASLQAVITQLRTGKVTGYDDPVVLAHVVNNGLITQSNAAQFTPQYNG